MIFKSKDNQTQLGSYFTLPLTDIILRKANMITSEEFNRLQFIGHTTSIGMYKTILKILYKKKNDIQKT